MDGTELREIYDRQMRRDMIPVDGERQVLPHVTRILRPPPRKSHIVYSSLGGADVDAVIEEEAEFAAGWGPMEWNVFDHDEPRNLRERLAARGFTAEEPEAIMVLDLATHGELADAPAPGVREVGQEASPVVRQILERVWGRPFDWLPLRFADDFRRPGGYFRLFLAEEGGQPVAAAWSFHYPGSDFVGLYGGSTLPEHRGRGHYHRLLSARAAAARAGGYRFLHVDAGPMSEPILERAGFLRIATAWPCTLGEDA